MNTVDLVLREVRAIRVLIEREREREREQKPGLDARVEALTLASAAIEFAKSGLVVERLLRTGLIRSVQVGGESLIPVSELNRLRSTRPRRRKAHK